MSKPVHFKLTIEIRCQQQLDVVGMVKVVNGLHGNTAMFKFRVSIIPNVILSISNTSLLDLSWHFTL